MLADMHMEAQRLAMLEAMGIDVYVLRTHADMPVVTASETAQASSEGADLVVVCARAAKGDAHVARLRACLPQAIGLVPSRILWIEPDAVGELTAPPPARAYLLLGGALTRALGLHLSTTQQNTPVIAVADEPAASLRDGLSKRALWQALKPVARTLRTGA